MGVQGLDPKRATRVAELVAECRPLLEHEGGMDAVQHLLADQGVGAMDSILVVMELLGGGPGTLGEAKRAVLSSPVRATERELHEQSMSELIKHIDNQ